MAQAIRLPEGGVNLKRMTGTRVGVTDIAINWNSPGVKGREGKIWGTPIAPFGFTVLGFGSDMESPWRAGANESTTISFSTDVKINGRKLSAGTYGFFIALSADTSTLIFNRNTKGWGSYFYDKSQDVLRVGTRQQKDLKDSRERLEYVFAKETDHSVEIALEWERWRIPFTVEVDLVPTALAAIRTDLSGALGFDPPSLQAAAQWCLTNQVNYEEALVWINRATDPNLGAVKSFGALSTKAGLLTKLNRQAEADQIMTSALDAASPIEMHQYGRRLLNEKKTKEAMAIFERNFKQNKGAWPTNVGMMRGYSATGNLKKALEHAKLALAQAPDDLNKQNLEQAVKTLESGKAL
jgi:tetratricopeptide (TPR) repeat protein